jgi:hypothetical protein
MMNNPGDLSYKMPSAPQWMEQSKKGLREFFQQKSVKNLVNILVPSALAAVLFPVFGPAVAAGAATVAIQNTLKALGISLSAETIGKVLKPLEGKPIEESDVVDVLQEVLPKDKQVNDEAAQALMVVLPEVKQSALENPKLDQEWLGKSLEISLNDQGETMTLLAPQMRDLIQLDQISLEEKIQALLANWSSNIQEMTATRQSKVTESEQTIEGRGGTNRQTMESSDTSEISHSKQNIKIM